MPVSSEVSADPVSPVRLSRRWHYAREQAISFLMQQAVENPDVISLAAGLVDFQSLPVSETRTALTEIFADDKPETLKGLRTRLADLGLVMSEPLGFRDNFALGMRKDVAEQLGIRRISDLRDHPKLVFRFGTEFMQREDGWPGLQRHYKLAQQDVLGVEHDLAYRGLAAGDADLTDLYTTDAEIAYYDLQVLEDDLAYFPPYDAVLLYRAELAETSPEALTAMLQLEGLIDEEQMIVMNAAVKIDGEQEQMVAADFLRSSLDMSMEAKETTRVQRLVRYTGQHIALVAASLSAAILIAVPLGIVAARLPRLGQSRRGRADRLPGRTGSRRDRHTVLLHQRPHARGRPALRGAEEGRRRGAGPCRSGEAGRG